MPSGYGIGGACTAVANSAHPSDLKLNSGWTLVHAVSAPAWHNAPAPVVLQIGQWIVKLSVLMQLCVTSKQKCMCSALMLNLSHGMDAFYCI